MGQLELLNNVTHAELMVDQAKLFDQPTGNCVLAFPTEFSDLQREYPILLQYNQQTEQFQAIALLGLENNENLYLTNAQWDAKYLPASIAKGPFSIGMQKNQQAQQAQVQPVVMIDPAHSTINDKQGTRIFKEFGGNSQYLDYINQVLNVILQGIDQAKAMYCAYQAMGLIEPLTLEITLKHNQTHKINGFYTISREKLARLNAEQVYQLNHTGLLEGAYLIANSLNNVQRLINYKNERIQAR